MKITHTKILWWHIDSRQEEIEDTKGAIRNRISKKNRQHNIQKKKHKRTNNDRKTAYHSRAPEFTTGF
jgi:hypothetical protein